jgi:hypothetical protein
MLSTNSVSYQSTASQKSYIKHPYSKVETETFRTRVSSSSSPPPPKKTTTSQPLAAAQFHNISFRLNTILSALR